MTLRAVTAGLIVALTSLRASAQNAPDPTPPNPMPAALAPCYDTPAVCHRIAGKALLTSNPKEAARELYASYTAENRTATYGLYAFALRLDHRYAASALVFRRVRTRLGTELEAAQRALTDAQARKDTRAITAATALVMELQTQLQNADSQLSGLESQTAHVRLRFAGSKEIVVVHKNEGDIKDPFTETILVNADDDSLIVSYPDGKTVEITVKVPGGSEQTIVVPAENESNTTATTPPLVAANAVEPRDPDHRLRWIGLGLLGGAAVALGASVVFQIQSNNAWNDAQAPGAGCVDDACERGSRGASLAQDSQNRAHVALGTAIAGAAFAASGIVLLVLDRRHADDASSSTALNVVPQSGGLAAFVTGRF
jgi:hypothetical protein